MNTEETWLLEEKYHGERSEEFYSDIERLNSGEPLAYVIGYVPFLDSKIYLDSKPLIPRPETEFWTEKAIAEIAKCAATSTKPIKVLDLCAGSGAIGVAVTVALPKVSVTFSELEPSHLTTIEKNLLTNSTIIYDSGKYEVIGSDLFEKVNGKFDFILSNPPYIDPVVDRATVSVKNHEPHLALYGGISGMEIIERIIKEAPAYLNDEGQLWLEHEPEQVEAINQLAKTAGFTCNNHNDQYGVKRYSTLTLLPIETVAK